MTNPIFRCYRTDGRQLAFYPQKLAEIGIAPGSVARCTGFKDDKGRLLFEGDYVEIYNHNNEMLHHGFVKYSPERTAFILVDEFGRLSYFDTLAELARNKICLKVKS